MGSEINSERANNSQDLRELQDAYRKRKQAVEEEGQSELHKARTDNAEQLRNENQSSQAAINHVRAANKERVEQVKADTDQKLTYERTSAAKALQTERLHDRESLDTVEEGVKSRQAQLEYNTRQLSKRESELRTKESESTNALAQDQSHRRAKIMSDEEKGLASFNEKVQRQRQELSAQGRNEINEVNDKNRKELQRLNEQHKQAYAKQQQLSEGELKAQRDQQTKNMNVERQEFTKTELAQRSHSQAELHNEQTNADQKFLEVKHENQQEADRARDKGVANMEKTRSYYDKNIAVIEKKGDHKIHEQQEIQEGRLRQMDEENKVKLEKAKGEHEQTLQTDHDMWMKQSTTNKEFYRQSLVQQKQEYDKAFNQNLESFQQQVETQREMLQNSLAKEKREVIQDVGKYNSKNGDPFYRLEDPKAKLHDAGDHYILETNVPEHERDNVKVVVHDNKVIVQGQRRFEDQVEDPDSRIETHNYQTYRQEIPLEHPVHEKYLQKSYDNGVLKIRIPKA